MITPQKNFFQMCWHVSDIHAAMKNWTEISGVGPFYYIEHPIVENYSYRGTPGTLDITAAIAYSGDTQIELIQQHDDHGSAYRDQFRATESGFHHIAAMVEDYDVEVANYLAQGWEIAHSGNVGDKRFCYFDTRSPMGFMTEILEENSPMRDMFAMIAEAAHGWDGSDPFRPIQPLIATS